MPFVLYQLYECPSFLLLTLTEDPGLTHAASLLPDWHLLAGIDHRVAYLEIRSMIYNLKYFVCTQVYNLKYFACLVHVKI